MIKLTMSDGSVKKFNLKNQEREMTLHGAWYAMHGGDEKYKTKAFNITTDKGEKLHLKISEITVEFDDACYVEARVGNVEDLKRRKKTYA